VHVREVGREERRAAARLERPRHAVVGQVRVRGAVERGGARAREQRAEVGVVPDVDAQRERLHEESGQVGELRAPAQRARDAGGHARSAARRGQQREPRREEHLAVRAVLGARESAQMLARRRREREVRPASASGAHARVSGPREGRGTGGEVPLPVREVARGARGVEARALPRGVVHRTAATARAPWPPQGPRRAPRARAAGFISPFLRRMFSAVYFFES
jgi:hypothetical protein